jgi:hypothetical protein
MEDRIDSRSPSPPARMTAITGFTIGRPSGLGVLPPRC